MKKMHVYIVYIDDGKNVIKVAVPALSEKAAKEYVQGNGDIVAIKSSDLQDIDLGFLADTLSAGAWGQLEIDVIVRALTQVGLAR